MVINDNIAFYPSQFLISIACYHPMMDGEVGCCCFLV